MSIFHDIDLRILMNYLHEVIWEQKGCHAWIFFRYNPNNNEFWASFCTVFIHSLEIELIFLPNGILSAIGAVDMILCDLIVPLICYPNNHRNDRFFIEKSRTSSKRLDEYSIFGFSHSKENATFRWLKATFYLPRQYV